MFVYLTRKVRSMKEHMPWIYLLLFISIILCINIYFANEGFEISTTSFSDFLLSIITINPDSSGNPITCPSNIEDSSGNVVGDSSGNNIGDSSGNVVDASCARPKPEPIDASCARPKPKPIEESCDGTIDDSKCITDSSLKTLHGYLKSDIEKLIKDEKLNERNKPLDDTCTAEDTNSLGQGASRNCTKPGAGCQRTDPSPIDMSEYIRKDSIPCWGCSIP